MQFIVAPLSFRPACQSLEGGALGLSQGRKKHTSGFGIVLKVTTQLTETAMVMISFRLDGALRTAVQTKGQINTSPPFVLLGFGVRR